MDKYIFPTVAGLDKSVTFHTAKVLDGASHDWMFHSQLIPVVKCHQAISFTVILKLKS